MDLDHLPFNWFDVVLVVVLFLGIQRGRKRGMSEELVSMLKWITVVLGCALVYQPLGDLIAGFAFFDRLTSYIMAYTIVALLIITIFIAIKHSAGGKLVGSDVFGKSEFYLGMLAGVVRFSCVLIAVLALLNARYYSPKEVEANLAYQNDVYGSDYFPTLEDVQAQVFERSLAGPWIANNLGMLLIKPTAPSYKQFTQKEYTLP